MRYYPTLAASLTIPVPTTAYVGDITYYILSEGSCGVYLLATTNIVALSYKIMANRANPN